MQRLLFLQSTWAMLRRHTDGMERTLEQNIEMIRGAGYDGISMPFFDNGDVLRAAELLRPAGLVMEGVCFPKSVADLEPALELASRAQVHHLDVQPNVRPRKLAECIPLLEGWRRLAEQARFPVYFETHRDRMTTDLYFTLDLLECFPDLRLVADLSHYLVGREFAYPVSADNHALIRRILDSSWAFHGRVASREQIQVEISFPQHRIWLDLFLEWWRHGLQSWRERAGENDSVAFVCELGPQPYAITGADGNDLVDRWEEALLLRDAVRGVWDALPAKRGLAAR